MAIPLTNMTVVGDMGDTVTTAYDLIAYNSLRPQLVYSMVSTVKPTRQSHRGSSVQFNFLPDLAANTTALTEAAEIAGKNMTDTTTSVTLQEYGDAIQTSALLRGTDFLEVDAEAAGLIGWQAGLSYDTLAREVLEDDSTIASADRVQFSNGAASETALTTGTHHIQSEEPAKATAQLRGDDARPFGRTYLGFIHPDVSYDLRQSGADYTVDEGSTNSPGVTSPGFGLWSYVAARNEDGRRVWEGVVGDFAGISFIETSTADVNATGGAGGTDDTYTTTIVGMEALACAFAQNVSGATPRIVLGPELDILRRFQAVGWHWLGGFAEFREEARHLILSASSLGGT